MTFLANPIHNLNPFWENVRESQTEGCSPRYLSSTLQKCQVHTRQGETKELSQTGRNMTIKYNDQDPELDPGTGLVKKLVKSEWSL